MNIDFDLFRNAIESEFVPELLTGKETHDPALRFVAQLVPFTQNEKLVQSIVAASLPEKYSGDTLNEVPEMVASAIAKGFDNSNLSQGDVEKISAGCVRKAQKSGVFLFHDRVGDGFISIPQNNGGQLSYRIGSRVVKSWVRHQYYLANDKPLPSQSLSEVIDTFNAMARFDGPLMEINIRLAGVDDCIFIDLGREDASVVKVTRDRWSVTHKHPAKFLRPGTVRELPIPEHGGSILELKKFLRLNDHSFILLVAFIVNCLRPDGPYFCLLVEGDQGSGKSFLSTIIKAIVDPGHADKLRLPKSDQDLMIQAGENHLLSFDNASGVKWDLSDALCSLSTGGGFSTRRLYTDTDSIVLNYCRPFLINGIGDYASRPDLLERSIHLHLPTMPAEHRRTEKEMMEEFDELLPRLLGAFFDVVAYALKFVDKVETPQGIRMADAARWLAAAESACGFIEGSFIHAITSNQNEFMADKIVNDPVTISLVSILQKGPYEGTVGELHSAFNNDYCGDFRSLPKTAAHLSNALQRLRPALRKLGISVEFGNRTRKGRIIRIEMAPDEDADKS